MIYAEKLLNHNIITRESLCHKGRAGCRIVTFHDLAWSQPFQYVEPVINKITFRSRRHWVILLYGGALVTKYGRREISPYFIVI